jgi:molybdenum cofactor cytidylyltransferase
MIPGIVLAGGASVRMGRPKLLLPIGSAGDTFASRIIDTLWRGGVEEVLIVVRPDVELGAALARSPRPVRVVVNPSPDRGQLSSLLAGLAVIDRPGVEAALVTLVDLPLVTPGTVEAVLDAYRRTHAPIVRPVNAGRHGHPVLFDRRLFDELRRADPAAGAKPIVHAHAPEIVEVTVEDEGAFTDVDTPADYESLIDR